MPSRSLSLKAEMMLAKISGGRGKCQKMAMDLEKIWILGSKKERKKPRRGNG